MADKSLGQHWLFDKTALQAVVAAAEIRSGDTVLEIGPGLGSLTEELLNSGAEVKAVEFDRRLITDLRDKFFGQRLQVIETDILKYDLNNLPSGYKVCANIPYYLTGQILRRLTEAANRPKIAVLLVQKEVAEKVTTEPGENSLLSIAMQLYADCHLGAVVPAELFSPPPKVDSRILIMKFYKQLQVENPEKFLRIVRAGFSSPRKKLRSSLSGGLGIAKASAEKMLLAAEIDPDRRAQTLSLEEWRKLSLVDF